MGGFIAGIYIAGFHRIRIEKFLCYQFFYDHFFTACNVIQERSNNRKLNHALIHFGSFAWNGTEVKQTEWINGHDLIKEIWIIGACHQWDGSCFARCNNAGPVSNLGFNKVGDHLDIQKIRVCHVSFFRTAESKQINGINRIFVTKKWD